MIKEVGARLADEQRENELKEAKPVTATAEEAGAEKALPMSADDDKPAIGREEEEELKDPKPLTPTAEEAEAEKASPTSPGDKPVVDHEEGKP